MTELQLFLNPHLRIDPMDGPNGQLKNDHFPYNYRSHHEKKTRNICLVFRHLCIRFIAVC